jgi:hypothetical protein
MEVDHGLFLPIWPLLAFSSFQGSCWPICDDLVVYVPMDVSDIFVRDVFHLLLFGCLKVVPPIDKVVVLDDFNVELGHG